MFRAALDDPHAGTRAAGIKGEVRAACNDVADRPAGFARPHIPDGSCPPMRLEEAPSIRMATLFPQAAGRAIRERAHHVALHPCFQWRPAPTRTMPATELTAIRLPWPGPPPPTVLFEPVIVTP